MKTAAPAHAAKAVPAREEFAGLAAEAPAPPRPRRSTAHWSTKGITRAVLWAVGLVGIGAIVYVVTPTARNQARAPAKAVETPASEPGLPVATGPFPAPLAGDQRLQLSLLRPDPSGAKAHNAQAVLGKFAEYLHVPGGQFLHLSDAAKPAVPPMKGAIEKAVTDFLGTSRPQDRVLLLFSGHAVEIEDEAVPSAPRRRRRRRPGHARFPRLGFEQLGKCPARQKVFIADHLPLRSVRAAQNGPAAARWAKSSTPP